MNRGPKRTTALLALVACWTVLPLLSAMTQGVGPQVEFHQLLLPATSQVASGVVTSRLGSAQLPGLETATLDYLSRYSPPASSVGIPTTAAPTCCFLRSLAKQPPTLRGPPSSVV